MANLSNTRRIITVYWNVVKRVHQDSEGSVLKRSFWPEIYFKEQPLLNLNLVINSNNDPFVDFTPESSTEYVIAIDSNFDDSTDPMVRASNSVINIAGDFESDDSSGNTDDADPDNGTWSARLNADTTSFETAIGTDKEKRNSYLELQAWTSGSKQASWQMPFRCLNTVDATGSTPGASTSFFSGTLSISSGISTATLTGAGFASAPSKVFLTVRKPTSSDLNLFATTRTDSLSTDGFIADLSGNTDSADYKLDYIVIL